MYGHKLILEDQMFEKGMACPANTNANCANVMRVGPINGALAICVVAGNAALAVSTGQTITLSYTECTTEGGSFAANANKVSAVKTLAAAIATPPKGTFIMRLPLPPDCGEWITANVATNDASVAGTLDVFLEYLAN